MKVISRDVLWNVKFSWNGFNYIVTFKENGRALLLDRVCAKDGAAVPPDEILNRARKEVELIRG